MTRQVNPLPKSPKAKKPARRWIAGHVSKEWRQARVWVIERSGGYCEAKTANCTGRAAQVHHIKRRSQGGLDEPANLIAVCVQCHTYIHANPAISKAAGWLA